MKGEGVRADLVAARGWFKKSAQNIDKAKFELGKMIIKGEGGTKDFRRGMELIMESRDRGYIKAIAWCDKLERHHDF